ncbi:MAG: hypothetical protein ABH824_04280 [Nanoarchaeota archaeon]
MVIKKEPFRRYNEEKKNDVITVWLNPDERAMLEESKKILEQTKDGTTLKQLAFVGAKLLGEEKMAYLLGVIYSNKRKNKRVGIPDFD